ncbi:hypothetical protein NUW58_g10138 [Xylaria curta]|uniref:Uncharacterized protein n=1 Tax=Xylaria curta TaxID=42375 RepID=A0ACC1MRF8_9PEZI|nr:hypothetical protein NUW58_g10138 [Xylaria curta]
MEPPSKDDAKTIFPVRIPYFLCSDQNLKPTHDTGAQGNTFIDRVRINMDNYDVENARRGNDNGNTDGLMAEAQAEMTGVQMFHQFLSNFVFLVLVISTTIVGVPLLGLVGAFLLVVLPLALPPVLIFSITLLGFFEKNTLSSPLQSVLQFELEIFRTLVTAIFDLMRLGGCL